MNNLLKIAENINTDIFFAGTVLYDEDLSKYTTFKIGGKATVFVVPNNAESLLRVFEILAENRMPSFVIGGGSNVVISDKGLDCVVISTSKLNNIEICEGSEKANSLLLTCGAGTTIKNITEFCQEHELSGMENFAGLPGSVGGAIFMNARCYEKSISDVVRKVKYIDLDSNGNLVILEYIFNLDDWDYKKSPFQNSDKIIISASFVVSKGNFLIS